MVRAVVEWSIIYKSLNYWSGLFQQSGLFKCGSVLAPSCCEVTSENSCQQSCQQSHYLLMRRQVVHYSGDLNTELVKYPNVFVVKVRRDYRMAPKWTIS